MKKYLLSILVIFVAFACKNSDTASHQDATGNIEENVQSEEDEQLLGKINKQELSQGSYAEWYNPNHDELLADEETINEIGKYIHDYKIVAFMGTWCSDSQREIPQFFNLLEKVNYDEDKLTLYAVNEDKETPGDKHKDFNIEYVPTIIFIKDGQEVNRFVEFAQESLANDILKIVKGEEYQNPYAE